MTRKPVILYTEETGGKYTIGVYPSGTVFASTWEEVEAELLEFKTAVESKRMKRQRKKGY